MLSETRSHRSHRHRLHHHPRHRCRERSPERGPVGNLRGATEGVRSGLGSDAESTPAAAAVGADRRGGADRPASDRARSRWPGHPAERTKAAVSKTKRAKRYRRAQRAGKTIDYRHRRGCRSTHSAYLDCPASTPWWRGSRVRRSSARLRGAAAVGVKARMRVVRTGEIDVVVVPRRGAEVPGGGIDESLRDALPVVRVVRLGWPGGICGGQWCGTDEHGTQCC